MVVSYVCIISSILRNHISFLLNASHIIKLKFSEIKNTVRVSSRMKRTKNPVVLHNFSKFMGILLFVLKYIYFLASENVKWVFLTSEKSWSVPLIYIMFMKLRVVCFGVNHTHYVLVFMYTGLKSEWVDLFLSNCCICTQSVLHKGCKGWSDFKKCN